MKKTLSALILSMLFCSVAAASPLTDYSQGSTAIDLTMRNVHSHWQELYGSSTTYSYQGTKYNGDFSYTLGLGNRLAVQYRYFAPQFNNYYSYQTIGHEMKTSEINVLYQLNKNVSVFAGRVHAENAWTNSYSKYYNWADYEYVDRNIAQVGVVGNRSIGSKTTLWGSLGLGRDLTDFTVGVGYKFSPVMEFNVDYRALTIKKFWENIGYTDEMKSKGLGFGLTYKY
ncbi:MAG: hypothetical protein H6Q74_268 [Firmicutes bacterium]|nr:hypothetical protein [Bacillota bacterium]